MIFFSAVVDVLCIVLPIVALAIGLVGGFFLFKFLSAKKLGDAKQLANKMVNDAINEAKTIRKEEVLKAKEEVIAQRNELEKEIKDRERELKEKEATLLKNEQRSIQREETLDKKEQNLEKKIENVEQLRADIEETKKKTEALKAELENANESVLKEVEKVAKLTREEAKAKLVESMVDEAKKDAVKTVREIEAQAKEEADKKAQNIVSLAVQRCAVDHSAEITVSVVNLPNDDMKGRIIGREGRNIRALESATGCDLIIDDTPEAVVLSCFDPVRREVARVALEKLISDGRIHPGRIEDLVEKARKDVDVKIKEAGENALYESGVFNIHPDLVKLLGRLRYRTSYGQNVLKHSLEVCYLAGLLASEIGADVTLCKRAGLLHDIGKSVDREMEGTHVSIGVDIAKKYKESKDVIHCIAAHHNDIDPTTVEAVIVQCADAISGARPGARRESLDNYVKRLEKLEEIANSFKGVDKSFAIQAGREIRIMVKPEVVDDATAVFMAKEIAKQIESEMEYPGQIKVNVIREMRSVEFAK